MVMPNLKCPHFAESEGSTWAEFRKPNLTEFGPSNFAKFNSLSSQTCLSAVLLKMRKERSFSTSMAATMEVRECLRAHLINVVRFLEGGNHDCDTFDYTLFRLDWVLIVLVRYLDTPHRHQPL